MFCVPMNYSWEVEMYCRIISLCYIIVLYLPWSKTIDISSSDVAIVGEEFTLSCTSTYNRVYWWINTETVGYSSTSYYGSCYLYDAYQAGYEFKSCGSEHTLTITSISYTRDHKSTWRCAYYYRYGQYYVYSDVYTIAVIVPVSYTKLISERLVHGTIQIEEDEYCNITCQTSFSEPPPIITICISNISCYKGDVKASSSGGYEATFVIHGNRSIDRTTITCVAEGVNSASVMLYILHSPRLQIIDDSKPNQFMLICSTNGRPDNITFLPWKHYFNNQLVREVKGFTINGSSYVLNITNKLHNQGTYTCTASNGIRHIITGRVNQEIEHKLIITVAPEIDESIVFNKSDSQVGRKFEFNVTFTSVSESDVSWYHDGMVLNQTDRLSISQEGTNISHPYNQNITIPAITAVLTITSVAKSDEGIYSSRVCNAVGCINTTCQLTVLQVPVLTIPQSPEDSTQNDQSKLIIAGSVGAACVIIIVVAVIVIVIVVIRRRRKIAKAVPNRVFTADQRQNNPAVLVQNSEQVEPIILENELYISADVWTGDAITSVGPLAGGPVYGKVNKTSKQGPSSDETCAPVYGSVNKNKSTARPVYGVVNKTPTTKLGKSRDKSKATNTLFYDNANNTDSSGQPVPVSDGRADGKHHRIKPLQDSNQNQICQSNVVYYNTSSEVVGYGDTDPYVNTTSLSTDGKPNPNPIDADPYVNTSLTKPT